MISAEIGRTNILPVLRDAGFGLYLDGGTVGDILLPKRYVPEGTAVGDTVEVFIYKDSEDRIIATTETPLVEVGEFAALKVVALNRTGAFLDWGLEKDLLVPFREQRDPLRMGRRYLVYVYLDPVSERIVASTRLRRYLSHEAPAYKPGERVRLRVWQDSKLGYEVLVNDQHTGMLYRNEVFQKIQEGELLEGYVKQVRLDGKIDCSLKAPAEERIDPLAEKILEALKDAGGSIPYTDKSPPEAIYRKFGCSKRDFKMSLGRLYKQRLVKLEGHATRLIDGSEAQA